MKKIVICSLAVAGVILLSGCSLTGQDVKTENAMMRKEALEKNDSMMEKEDAMVKEDTAMMKKDDSMMAKQDNAMMKKDATETEGSYTVYSEAAVENALASGKKVALFFHAPWCPSCKAADTGLLNSTAPENMVVFKTDYDTNTELRKKYSVTSQHTFVSLNADGSLKEKSSGEKSYAEIAELF